MALKHTSVFQSSLQSEIATLHIKCLNEPHPNVHIVILANNQSHKSLHSGLTHVNKRIKPKDTAFNNLMSF